MNPQDLIMLAKEIYAIDVALHPEDWDKQKMARQAIESAKQFALVLQSEKEGSAYLTYAPPRAAPPRESPTESTEQSGTVHSVLRSLEERKQAGNQQAAGRGMVRQHYFGQEMG